MSHNPPDQNPERLPPIPSEQMTAAQRRAAEAVARSRRGALYGPFVAMLRSPELLDRAQQLGDYLRYDCAIPARLRELAILLTARHFRQAFEWHVHAPLAAQAGLAPATIADIAAGLRPQALQPGESVVYDFCVQLLTEYQVHDATYAEAHRLLEEQGLIDLCGVVGYYGMLAMVMNVARTALPRGVTAPW